MRTLTSRVAVITLIALCAVAALGQSHEMLQADIPFDFSIGNKMLSSGTYTVTNLVNKVECMRDTNGKSVLFLTIPIDTHNAGGARLIFHRYGSEVVLAEVWANDAGYELGTSKQEKKLAKAGNYETISMLLEPVQ